MEILKNPLNTRISPNSQPCPGEKNSEEEASQILLSAWKKLLDGPSETHSVDAIIMDGAVLVQMLKPIMVQTFKGYSDCVFKPHVLQHLEPVGRIDMVWDVYLKNSLKSSARVRRGSGACIKVGPKAKIPKNWESFLRVDENKTKLFLFLAR